MLQLLIARRRIKQTQNKTNDDTINKKPQKQNCKTNRTKHKTQTNNTQTQNQTTTQTKYILKKQNQKYTHNRNTYKRQKHHKIQYVYIVHLYI